MSDSFIPEDYVAPTSSNKFMKLVKGSNRIRILSAPVMGNVAWEENEGKKSPVRIKLNEDFPMDKIIKNPKRFWCMVVWSYDNKAIQLLEVTQSSIQNALVELNKHPKWGSPVDSYDITIKREGDGMETTTYSVLPDPKEAADPAINDFLIDSKMQASDIFGSQK